ncbi:MAG: Hemin uptake protein hemP [Rhodocyclales bacterium]|nr:Hemin uptake protein hemP [Rhodocyclales bacterium]
MTQIEQALRIDAITTAAQKPLAATPLDVRIVRSKDILQSSGHALIEHNGTIYTLHATRSGKLILTK